MAGEARLSQRAFFTTTIAPLIFSEGSCAIDIFRDINSIDRRISARQSMTDTTASCDRRRIIRGASIISRRGCCWRAKEHRAIHRVCSENGSSRSIRNPSCSHHARGRPSCFPSEIRGVRRNRGVFDGLGKSRGIEAKQMRDRKAPRVAIEMLDGAWSTRMEDSIARYRSFASSR